MTDKPRVLVTQPEPGRLAAALTARGADVWSVPTIRIAPPDDWRLADAALGAWTSFDWAIFTSGNAVRAVRARMEALGMRPSALPQPRIAAVGAATAGAVDRVGWRVHGVPERYTGEALALALSEGGGLAGARVFVPRGDLARDLVPGALRAAGADVVEVTVYRTVPAEFDAAAVREALVGATVAAVTFMSPSAAMYFVRALGRDIWKKMLARVLVASIGPTTSAGLRKLGRPPDIEAPEATAETLADAVVAALEERARR